MMEMPRKKFKNFFQKSVDKGEEKIYYHLARRRKERRARKPTGKKEGGQKLLKKSC